MTVHFYLGCPYADGSRQMADTDQRFTWDNVSCKLCLKNKDSHYGKTERIKNPNINPKTDVATEEFIKKHRSWFKTEEAHLKYR